MFRGRTQRSGPAPALAVEAGRTLGYIGGMVRTPFSQRRYASGVADDFNRLPAEARDYIVSHLRDVILPALAREIAETGAQAVIEIGCTSGRLVQMAGENHPAVSFLGIDFEVPGWSTPNVAFQAGYAPEMIAGVAADILIARSTLCVMAPDELERLLAANPCRSVVSSDPVVAAPGDLFDHDIAGRLTALGYAVVENREVRIGARRSTLVRARR